MILSAVSGKASKDISESIGVSAIRTILILFKFIFYSIIPIWKWSLVHSIIESGAFTRHYHLLQRVCLPRPTHIVEIIR